MVDAAVWIGAGEKWNIKHALDYLYFLVGFFFILRWSFFLRSTTSWSVVYAHVAHFSSHLVYTFSRFLMCKRHIHARARNQCMASHKQKC